MPRRQERFVQEYLVDLNGTQAAIRAGYSVDTAEVKASYLLKLTHVKAAVKEGRRRVASQADIRAKDVISQIAMQAFFDPRRIVDPNTGGMLTLAEFPDDLARAVQAIEVTSDSRVGVVATTTTKIKFADRNRAADMLCRHLGLYEADNKQGLGALASLLEHIAQNGARLGAGEPPDGA